MTIEKELKKVLEQFKSIELAKNHLEKLVKRTKKMEREIPRLHKILEKEYRDFERLQKLNIKRLFVTILGNVEEQLEIERQEYLQAFLEYKDLCKNFELMQFEEKILKEKIRYLPQVEERMEALILMREDSLRGDRKYQFLVQTCNKEIDDIHLLKREIYEAKIAGTKVKVRLEKMINLLLQAADQEDWTNLETYKPMQGKKFVQKAQKLFYEIKPLILTFEDELADIYKHRNIKLMMGLDSAEKFSKIYYDNLISDWVVKKRIYNALSNIEALYDRIIRSLQSIDQEEKKSKERLKDIIARKKQLIIDSV